MSLGNEARLRAPLLRSLNANRKLGTGTDDSLALSVRALAHCSAAAAYAIHHHQLRRAVQRRSYEGWSPATSHAGMARGVTETRQRAVRIILR